MAENNFDWGNLFGQNNMWGPFSPFFSFFSWFPNRGWLDSNQSSGPSVRQAPKWTPPQLMQSGENTQPGLLNRPYTNPWATRNPWNNQ